MLDRRHRELIEVGDRLFADRQSLESLWQEIAENFYPERATFTATGDTITTGLDTSFPILARRDLGDAIGAIMRPGNADWFTISIKRDEGLDEEGRRWLDMAKRTMWRALYDRESQFVRATKEGDHDFATFGQCIISSELAVNETTGPSLLHRCWHLKDVAWQDDSHGKICHVARNWKMGAAEMLRYFPKTVSDQVKKVAEKEPYREFNVRHVIVRKDEYESKSKLPYVSLYVDCDNATVLEEKPVKRQHYIIPRWKTVSGSPYGFSPATVAALPDARLIQAMTYTLMTAGEYMINPPLIGVQEAIRGTIEAFPGGYTAVDAAYDERLGEVLRPLQKGGERSMPIGLEMTQDIRKQISEAFFLSKLAMPAAGLGGMSPLEVQQRNAEFVRQALPLFEPMETEYNGALMDQNLGILMEHGAFGPLEEIPESLMGQDTEFRFESPLRQSVDRMKGQQFTQAMQLMAQGAQIDQSAAQMMDIQKAQRDAMHGSGIPPQWLRSEKELAQIAQQQQQAQAMQGMMGGAERMAPVVKELTEAAKNMRPEPAQ